MAIIFMYALMIFDLMMTLIHHEEAGELNPLFERLLTGEPVHFIYIKLLFNSLAAFGILILTKYRPIMGKFFTILGIIVYAIVAYLHVEVYRLNADMQPLIPSLTKWIDAFFY
jgi:hypothetical protein